MMTTANGWRGSSAREAGEAIDRAIAPARASHGGMPLVYGEVAVIARRSSAWRAVRTFLAGVFFFAALLAVGVFMWAA